MKNNLTELQATTAKHNFVDFLHGPIVAWSILLISVIFTVVAWNISNNFSKTRTLDRFNFRADEAQVAIQKRLQEYAQMLRGGVGLFLSSSDVSRDEWHTYVENLQIEKNWPGIQGVGFSLWIPPEKKAAHIKKIRQQGFPDYIVKPEGERPAYTSIIYLEPFSERNKRAFGFDMFSEPTRRAAMTRARDTGEAAISGKVTLVQETKTDVQAGFLMYLPLYTKPTTTPQEREATIKGFVYSPFRIRDLMRGILGGDLRDVNFTIYDGKTRDNNNLLYDTTSQLPNQQQPHLPQFNKTSSFVFGGNTWTITYSSTMAFEATNDDEQPLVVAIGGIAVDLLLFYIVISLSGLRQRALALANDMVGKLGEQQLHFKSISDTANDAIISADEQGNINYFNKAAQTIFGYKPTEIIGQPLTNIMPESYRSRHALGFSNFINSDRKNVVGGTLELQGLRKNGEEFPIELSLSHWRTNGKHHINAVIRDITERKKVERLKSEFISTVSHELRTPLTAIRGALALLGHNNPAITANKGGDMLTLANNNIERLGRLIDDLLDVEKLESSHLRMTLQAYALHALLSAAIANQSPAAKAANITLQLTNNSDVMIIADQDRFQQIMANLLSNAIKFSPSNSRIDVTTQVINDHVKINIIDQGSGIPDEFRNRIFQKFAQADSSDSRAKGGTGLGLSICKMLVEHIGGSIDYTSAPGNGTTFFFTLPIAQQAKSAVGH